MGLGMLEFAYNQHDQHDNCHNVIATTISPQPWAGCWIPSGFLSSAPQRLLPADSPLFPLWFLIIIIIGGQISLSDWIQFWFQTEGRSSDRRRVSWSLERDLGKFPIIIIIMSVILVSKSSTNTPLIYHISLHCLISKDFSSYVTYSSLLLVLSVLIRETERQTLIPCNYWFNSVMWKVT